MTSVKTRSRAKMPKSRSQIDDDFYNVEDKSIAGDNLSNAYYAVFCTSDNKGNITLDSVETEEFDSDVKTMEHTSNTSEKDDDDDKQQRYGFRIRRLKKKKNDDEFDTSLCDNLDDDEAWQKAPSSDDEAYDITTDNWAFVRGGKRKILDANNKVSPKRIAILKNPGRIKSDFLKINSCDLKKSDSMLEREKDYNLKKPSEDLNDARLENAPNTVLNPEIENTSCSENPSPTAAVTSSSTLLKVSPTFKKLSQKIRCGYNSTSSKITEIRHIRRRRLNPKRSLQNENLPRDDISTSSEDERSSAIPNTVKLSRSKRHKSANIPLTTDISSVQQHEDSKLKTKYESPVRTYQKGIKIVIRRQSNQHGNNSHTTTATDSEKATTSVIVSSIRNDNNLQNKQTVTKPRNHLLQLHSTVPLKRICKSNENDDVSKNTTGDEIEVRSDTNKDEYVKSDVNKDDYVKSDANKDDYVKSDANKDDYVKPTVNKDENVKSDANSTEYVKSVVKRDDGNPNNEDEIQKELSTFVHQQDILHQPERMEEKSSDKHNVKRKKKVKRKKRKGRKPDEGNPLDSQHTAMRLDMELPGLNWLVKKHQIREKELEGDEGDNTAINLSEDIGSNGQIGNEKSMDNMLIQPSDNKFQETIPTINNKGTSMVGVVKPFNHLKMSPIAREVREEMSPPPLLIAEEDDSDVVRESYNIPQSSDEVMGTIWDGMRGNNTEEYESSSSSQVNSDISSQSVMTSSQGLQGGVALTTSNQHRLDVYNTISLQLNFSSDAKRLLTSSNLQSIQNGPVIVSSAPKEESPRSIPFIGKAENIQSSLSTNLPNKIHSPTKDFSQAEIESTIKISNCVSLALDLTKKKENEQNGSCQPLDLSLKRNTINESPVILDLSMKKKPTQPQVQNQPHQPSASAFVSRVSQHSVEKSENKQKKIFDEMFNNIEISKPSQADMNNVRQKTSISLPTEKKNDAPPFQRFSLDNQQNNSHHINLPRKLATPRDHIVLEVSAKHKGMKSPVIDNSPKPTSRTGITSNPAQILRIPSKVHSNNSYSRIISKTSSIGCHNIKHKGITPKSTTTQACSGRTNPEFPSKSPHLPPVPSSTRIDLTVDPTPVTPMATSSSNANVNNKIITTNNPNVKRTSFPTSACLTKQVTRHRSLELSSSSKESDVQHLEPFITQQQRILDKKIQELESVKRSLNKQLHVSQQTISHIKTPPTYAQQRPPPRKVLRNPTVRPINNTKSTPTNAFLFDHPQKSSIPRFPQTKTQHLPPPSTAVSSTYQQYKHNFVSNPTSHSSNLIQNKIPAAYCEMIRRTQPPAFKQDQKFNLQASQLSTPTYHRSPSFPSQRMPTPRYSSSTSLHASLNSPVPNKHKQLTTHHPNYASKMQSKSIPAVPKMHPVPSRAPYTVINETTKAFKARVDEPIVIEDDQPNNLPTKPRQQRAYSENIIRDAKPQQSHPRLSNKQFMEAVARTVVHQDQSRASKSADEFCVKCKDKAYFLCSGCRKVWYCSKPCQLNDWTRHSTRCSY